MKKKIFAIAVAVCLAVMAVAGASLAYFTDEDSGINIFTSGKVDITLNEVFDPATAQLIPGINVQKQVTVSLSEDSVECYIWYTYAIPAALDDGEHKVLHVNHAGRNILEYRQDAQYWADGQTAPTPEESCWILNDEIVDTIEVDGVTYNVYAVLYNGILKAGEETTVGMSSVCCDAGVDYDHDLGKYTINGQPIDFDFSNVQVIVTAYGIQAATFASVQEAYDAYNTQPSAIPAGAVDIE